MGKRHLFILAICMLLATTVYGAPLQKGLWVVRYNLATPQEVDQVVAAAASSGIDAIFAQVCGRAEAYYTSDLLPQAPGIAEGFDPLAYLLEAAHQEGITVHAWVNAYTAASMVSPPTDPKHVINQHPEWVLVDNEGRSLLEYHQPTTDLPAIFLDPGAQGVQEYVLSLVGELLEEYEVDGIHLDYIRYPSPEYGYSPSSRQRFQKVYGWDPLLDGTGHSELWDHWRRSQVTQTVRRVRELITKGAPETEFSAAVFFDPEKSRLKYLQDWPDWVKEELVDFLVPMTYFEEPADFAMALTKIKDQVGVEKILPGIGAYKLIQKPEDLRQEIQTAGELGFAGMVFFEYRTMAEAGLFTSLM